VCSHSAVVCNGPTISIFDLAGCEEDAEPVQRNTVSFSSTVEQVAWSFSESYAVVADAAGGLNFMMRDGKVLFRHPLLTELPTGATDICVVFVKALLSHCELSS